jgi:GMP synthase (glutamine-hydrolysing)
VTSKEKESRKKTANLIIKDELDRAGIMGSISKFKSEELPIETVGIMGDQRTYQKVVCVQILSKNSQPTNLPYDVLEAISSRITNEIPGINKVVYDVTPKDKGLTL